MTTTMHSVRTRRGIPGMMTVDHVALTVPDLDAAASFYCEVIGGGSSIGLARSTRGSYLACPTGAIGPRRMSTSAGPGSGSPCSNLRGGCSSSSSRYETPPTRAWSRPATAILGGHHIALRVENLEAAKAYLSERGLRVMAGPIAMTEGPCAGLRANYFLDPWGNQLEIVEYGELPYKVRAGTKS